MLFRRALGLWAKEAAAAPLRYFRAVLTHPTATFHPGVRIGVGCEFGRNVTVFADAILAGAVIDDYSYIGGASALMNCSIGKFPSVGPNVGFGLGVHPTNRVSTYPGFYSANVYGATKFFEDNEVLEYVPVTIGSDVWIGAEAIVLDGVTVGDGAVIASNAVVTVDVAPYTIVGGVPAKVIRRRFDQDMVDFLLRARWWMWRKRSA